MKSMAETIRFVLCALFTLGGLFILITGVVGVYRFRYALNRVHSAALIDTLGILLMLIGVMIANSRSQAVTDTKLEELTREVREHNNFARRVPILEEQMKVANHRIADLEANEHERERN